jgi:hypothetical protein
MKINDVDISLAELQEALREFCAKRGVDPDFVNIVSHDLTRIYVEMCATGMVEGTEFRHRASR